MKRAYFDQRVARTAMVWQHQKEKFEYWKHRRMSSRDFDSKKNHKVIISSVNCYALVLTHKSSFRPLEILRTDLDEKPRFSIHRLSPSHKYDLPKGFVVNAVCEEGVNLNETTGEAEVENEGEMIIFWPCLNENFTFKQFWQYTGDKHGVNKLFPTDFLATALKFGKHFIVKIQNFLDVYGYTEGKKYNCYEFLKRIEAYLGVKPEIVFKKHKNVGNCFHILSIIILFTLGLKPMDLYSIIILFTLGLKPMDYKSMEYEKLNESSVFLLESLRNRVQSKLALRKKQESEIPTVMQSGRNKRKTRIAL